MAVNIDGADRDRLALVLQAAASLTAHFGAAEPVVLALAGTDVKLPSPSDASGDDEASDDEVLLLLQAIVAAAQPRGDEQGSAGAFYTPPRLATHIVASALDASNTGPNSTGPNSSVGPTVLDPTCGGGAVLLSAAEELLARGHDAAPIVPRLFGGDLDPVAVLTARLVLGLWSIWRAGHWETADIRVVDAVHSDGPDHWSGRFDLVVGNPPFLGQLKSATNRSSGERRSVGPLGYADAATVVLDRSLGWVRDGGAMALLQPRSFLSARDAARVRRRVATEQRLVGLWVDAAPMFDAGVRVCLPVIVREPATAAMVRLWSGLTGLDDVTTLSGEHVPVPVSGDWAAIGAALVGVPAAVRRVSAVSGGRTLGDLADVHADFRDWFYDVAEVVTEASADGGPELRVLTSGAIEPLRSTWGVGVVKILRRAFTAPVVPRPWLDARPDGAHRVRPKVIVANQTKILEVHVDDTGTHVGLTPTISVVPHRSEDLHLVAALLASPLASAHVAALTAGSGLSATAMRVTAESLRSIPVPPVHEQWQRAAELVRNGAGPLDVAEMMAGAWPDLDGTDGAELLAWWRDRLRPGQF